MQLFRYTIYQYGDDYKDCRLSLSTYEVLRETAQSYWIYVNTIFGKKYVKEKLVRKGINGKWARETRKQALGHFIDRTSKRIWFLEADLEIAKRCLDEANEEYDNLPSN